MSELSDVEFVDQVYRLLLRRDPLPEDRERCLSALETGTLSRATLVHEVVTSEEFTQIRALDDAVAHARSARLADERPRGLTAPSGTDERPIEISWVLSRYRGERRVVDVGYANAAPAYVDALLELGAAELVGVDLAELEVPGLRSVRADVRRLPFEDGSVDVAFCISTLEHVGHDNTQYGLAAESDSEGSEAALRELGRVLGSRGRLLLTVPCGEPADLGSFAQRDPAGWVRLFEESGLFVFEQETYELREEGWRSVPDLEPPGVRYGERGPGASAVLCAELHPGRLKHAARQMAGRAVRAVKPG